MYNTEFIVKYYDIEQELLLKKDRDDKDKDRDDKDKDRDDETPYEYQKQDILDICDKLYKDELCSVFHAENIFDEKIDEGIHSIITNICVNAGIKSIIDEMSELYYQGCKNNDDLIEGEGEGEGEGESEREGKGKGESEREEILKYNCKHIINITLFSQPVFHITHKCICQQLCLGSIDNDLLLELRHSIFYCMTFNS